MGVKSTCLLLALLFVSGKTAVALDVGEFDLRTELENAKSISVSTIAQATCIKTETSACSRMLYKIILEKVHVGEVDSEHNLIADPGLVPGATYLHYVVGREIDRGEIVTNVFLRITSQSTFSGTAWSEKRWLMLPKGVSGDRFGAVRLGTKSCYVDADRGRGVVKLCEYVGVVEYGKIEAFLRK